MDLLAFEYDRIPGLWGSAPNGCLGDGDRIEAFRKNGAWHFAFSYGWGDCPAGCANRSYWYVRVDSAGAALEGRLPDPFWRIPIVHRWNIPARFAATAFPDIDSLRAALSDPVWWTRVHAVTVAGGLVQARNPWVGEDFEPVGHFAALKADLLARRIEFAAAIFPLIRDADADVAAAALRAHQLLLGLASPHAHYYPMRVGNSWEFTGSSNARTERITGVIEDSVRVKHYVFDHLRWMDSVQLRFAGDDKVYLTAGGRELPWLDFGAAPGTRWTISDPFQPSSQIEVRLESASDSVTVPAGSFRDVYRFTFFGGMDNAWTEWYAPFTGPVKREFSGIALWEYNLASFREADTTTSVQPPASMPPAFMPGTVVLAGSYPNPFSHRASIRFRVDAASIRVRLSLHDALGREVALLGDGEYAGGAHELTVDGSTLPPGLYICRVQAPGVQHALTVMLAR